MKQLLIFIQLVLLSTFVSAQDTLSHELDPCTESTGFYLNFKIDSIDIHETECENLTSVYNEMTAQGQTFAIIGIYSKEEEKSMALLRAKFIKEELIKMGMSADKLIIYAQYHEAPKEGEPHDWPFYPDGFIYEIGVHFQIEY